jgi:hypothetical protein
MSPQLAKQFLHTLARQWRRKIYAAHAVRSLGLALIATAGLAPVFGLTWVTQILFAAGVFGACFLFHLFLNKNQFIDEVLIARHLNRALPELEESCELALKSESALTTLERMQRARVLEVLNTQQTRIKLPRRSEWKFFSAAAALALLVAMIAPRLASKEKFFNQADVLLPAGANKKIENSILQIDSTRIEILPPRYTGKPQRRQTRFDLTVEEGAHIVWHLTANQEITRGLLILSETDTLQIQPSGGLIYKAQAKITENGFYYFVLNAASGSLFRSDYGKLETIKDSPPNITILSPPQSTEIAPGQSTLVDLQAVAEDDYALTHAKMIATLARGSGEAVKFREDTLAFGEIKKDSPRRWNLRAVLDLIKLGMTPGDELYFFIEAHDNREPENNRSRSETFFITLQDTARVQLAARSGLGVNPLPEYFRSQRQIIIDTEKLIKEKNQISAADFKNRSNNLGLDQQALRLRYGEFLGEESNHGINRAVEYGGEEAEHEEPDLKPKTGKEDATITSVVEQFMHAHDAEENATRLAQSVKSMLQAALAEMWEAELHLRTHRPETALPYEYRALKWLKEVQQHSRVYVQRVGFEPTPIKVDEKRLRGDLSKINHRRHQKDLAENKSLPNVRQALQLLQRLKSPSPVVRPRDAKILEKAAQELARFAVEQPGRHLYALQSLRELITRLDDRQRFCNDCIAVIERAMWNLIPPETPAPTRQAASSSELSRLYFKKIGAAQ